MPLSIFSVIAALTHKIKEGLEASVISPASRSVLRG